MAAVASTRQQANPFDDSDDDEPPPAPRRVRGTLRITASADFSIAHGGRTTTGDSTIFITGERGEEIDHVELFGLTDSDETDSKNFVLCPGAAWDRSPCGTGTSAKIACLAADGTLAPGAVWRQASTIGSVFEVTYKQGEPINGHASVVPAVTGSAWVNGEATLLVNEKDPFALGIRG